MPGKQPLYRIRFIKGGYYSPAAPWKGTGKRSASKLTHKEARSVCSRLKGLRRQGGLNYSAVIEQVIDD